jgi:hypothetical protein
MKKQDRMFMQELTDEFEPGWLDKLNRFEPVIDELVERVDRKLADRKLVDEYVSRGHRLEVSWSD